MRLRFAMGRAAGARRRVRTEYLIGPGGRAAMQAAFALWILDAKEGWLARAGAGFWHSAGRSRKAAGRARAALDFDLAEAVSKGELRMLRVVGIGPGGADQMTPRALAALRESSVIVGYSAYVELVRPLYPEKEFVATAMRGEEERCRIAVERAAAGEEVSVI